MFDHKTSFRDNITLLGTGTCQLQKDRMASSVLVQIGRMRAIYDFGRGVSQRLIDCSLRQDDISAIIISHFHPDHFSDLVPYIHAALYSKIDPRTTKLAIYGPRGVVGLTESLFNIIGSRDIKTARFGLEVNEIQEQTLFIGDHAFSFHDLASENDHGLKFLHKNKVYAFTGDFRINTESINFLQNIDFAVVNTGHLELHELVRLSVTTQVRTIICSHLYSELDGQELNTLAKKEGYTGEIIIGKDLMSFPI